MWNLVNQNLHYTTKTLIFQPKENVVQLDSMNREQLLQEVRGKLDTATEHFKQEIGKIRTGRAHPAMLNGVMVEVYGQSMPLKAVASITAPEAQLLQVTPFDPNNLQAISEAISKDESLGLNPAD